MYATTIKSQGFSRKQNMVKSVLRIPNGLYIEIILMDEKLLAIKTYGSSSQVSGYENKSDMEDDLRWLKKALHKQDGYRVSILYANDNESTHLKNLIKTNGIVIETVVDLSED